MNKFAEVYFKLKQLVHYDLADKMYHPSHTIGMTVREAIHLLFVFNASLFVWSLFYFFYTEGFYQVAISIVLVSLLLRIKWSHFVIGAMGLIPIFYYDFIAAIQNLGLYPF